MTHDPATLAAGAAMSRPTDPLRDKIAALVEKHTVLGAPQETASEIAALVRERLTSDVAVAAAAKAIRSAFGYCSAPVGSVSWSSMLAGAAMRAAAGGTDDH